MASQHELTMENAALQFVLVRHGYQTYGDVSYFRGHLIPVAEEVALLAPRDTTLYIAALLHDILEDTTTTVEEVRTCFGEEISGLVEALTGRGETRKARVADSNAKIQAFGPRACLIKLADRYCNIKSCVENANAALLRMYSQEHDAISPLLLLAAENAPNRLHGFRLLHTIDTNLMDGVFRARRE